MQQESFFTFSFDFEMNKIGISCSILRLWEAGIIYKLTDDEFDRQKFELKKGETEGGREEKRRAFTLGQMEGSFVALGAGLVVAGASVKGRGGGV